MQYHPAVEIIREVLDQHQVWYETFEHEPVRTSEEAASLRDGYTLHQGAKALIIRVKYSKQERAFVMLVLPGDRKFDVAKANKVLGSKDIRFATPDEIAEITAGIVPGGVPPFGQLFGLPVYVDPEVLENEKIIFNAGDRAFSIAMHSADYLTIVQPEVVELI